MHVFGRVAEPLQDTDVLLGGYGADTLFKTHYMTNVRKSGSRLVGLNSTSTSTERKCLHSGILFSVGRSSLVKHGFKIL